uniref:Fe-S_biosyn domain-containing protein n=1 Tax=Rhabditophanes sp. KR3021 TaxID=114890 RepID=A0AC35THB8_9BILA
MSCSLISKLAKAKQISILNVRGMVRPVANLPFYGVYRQDGEVTLKDDLLVCQKMLNYHPGRNVYFQKDRHIYMLKSSVDGKVVFSREKVDLDMEISEVEAEYKGKEMEDLFKLTVNVISYEESESNFLISDKCAKRLSEVLKTGEFLRVEVQGGGCSGFEYKFKFDTVILAGQDLVYEKNGVKVVVDDVSMEYLKGSTLDYTSDLLKTTFKISNNPIAEKGCSCGSSFAPRLD